MRVLNLGCRVIAAALFVITALLGLPDLNIACGRGIVLGYDPLGWLNGIVLSCRAASGMYSDTAQPYDVWAPYAIAFAVCLCVCMLALLTCAVLVLIIKKMTTAGLVVGLILGLLCLASTMYVVIVQPWMSDPIGYLLIVPIPVVFIFSMVARRRWLKWLWRIVLILTIIYPLVDMVMTIYHPYLLGTVIGIIRANTDSTLIFAALLVLAFTPRSTRAAAEAIPREDASSLWYGVLGFVIPVVGLIGWLMWRKPTPLRARSVGIGALVGTIAYAIVGVVYYLVNHSNTMNALY